MPGYKPETWNPIVGCSKVSPGCDNCYAERMAVRLASMPNQSVSLDYKCVLFPDQNNKQTSWNGHTIFRQEQLLIPFKWKTPRMIFVCSMGDLFHESVSHEFKKLVFQVIHDKPTHIFVVLTKRPESMAKFFSWLKNSNVAANFPNLWLGVTAENQEEANKRIPILLQIPAAKRFVSIEPMLGPVDLAWIADSSIHAIDSLDNNSITHDNNVIEKGLDWVICGGESGPKARPMHPDWVRTIRDQCQKAGVPFFFKQWGEWVSANIGDVKKYPLSILKGITDHRMVYAKVGRKAAGDLLDGKEWHEWPKSLP
ncbi:MAG TPA: phage Gp37/Gp68 family protein [Prolixibacteraceae bacterium]|nr:phage Gp37/Gp68 family protein [Prolixibacteraceae bacterium]